MTDAATKARAIAQELVGWWDTGILPGHHLRALAQRSGVDLDQAERSFVKHLVRNFALSTPMPAGELREVVRHKACGTLYEVIASAELQAATGDVEEGAILTIYQGADGKVWARRAREFGDGRFERVSSALAQPGPVGDGWETSYELMQGDDWCAGTSGPTALAEIQHYAAVYGQDGPVQIIEVRKRPLPPPPTNAGEERS